MSEAIRGNLAAAQRADRAKYNTVEKMVVAALIVAFVSVWYAWSPISAKSAAYFDDRIEADYGPQLRALGIHEIEATIDWVRGSYAVTSVTYTSGGREIVLQGFRTSAPTSLRKAWVDVSSSGISLSAHKLETSEDDFVARQRQWHRIQRFLDDVVAEVERNESARVQW